MAFEIVTLSRSHAPPNDGEAMLISETPSGSWDVYGSAPSGDGRSAEFLIRSHISTLEEAKMIAADWGEPRGFRRIYVKPNASE